MGGAKEEYTKEMHERFGYLATWAPNVVLKPGDVGIIKRHEFSFVTTLDDLGIRFRVRRGDNRASYEHLTVGAVSVHTKAAGEAPLDGSQLTTADAGVFIRFSRANAVYFRADNAVVHGVLDQDSLGKTLIARYETGEWDKEYSVVTEIVISSAATILISSGTNARVDLKAGAELKPAGIHTASGAARLAIASSESIQTRIVGEGGLTPLFNARRVKPSLLGMSTRFRAGECTSFNELTYEETA